ncbi:AAA family ATPase [Falsigemmobacter faecalis]|uniref:Uncharacterized protein n=1 Tax=Falsigemmobacter faecalis TaxID=2488730 RepID=A0A3P3DSJ0_9RHOB|nr:AAA family ATPase [Falsigemmobacter faecalis]RRH76904.1 hypothetical protein EG244_04660 [Falsigemmobacter faecalis]
MNRMTSPPRDTLLTSQGSSLPLRVCTICDGVDAVIRLASWLSHLPANAERVDLELTDAVSWLTTQSAETFDMLVIAPNAARSEATPRILRAVLSEMGRRAGMQVVLLPAGARLSLPDLPAVHVLNGPPFPPPSTLFRRPEAAEQLPEMPVPSNPRGVARRFARWFPGRGTQPAPGGRQTSAGPSGGPLRVIAVQSLCGGAGGTTFASGLALELAEADPQLSVCVMDLDLQFGSLAAGLALPHETRVLETYRNPRAVDGDMFRQSLQHLRPNLTVFSAPPEILPLDAVSGADLQYLLGLARDSADLLILDLPGSVTDWTEAAYLAADRICLIARLDVRSAGNLKRLRSLVSAQVLPPEKICPVVNFRPQRPPREWAARIHSLETGMGLPVHLQLPDGGQAVGEAADSGIALIQAEPASALRLALQAYAGEIAALVPKQQRLQGSGF